MIGLFTTKAGRLVLGVMFMVVVASLGGISSLSLPVASKHKDPGCSVSPSAVAVNQGYTISAFGLPTSDPVYLITTPPGKAGTVSQVAVNADGTWSSTTAADGAGTWSYVFSGLLNSNKYGAVASCSVRVT